IACEPIDEKLRKALKKGKITAHAGADLGSLAREKNLLSPEEYAQWSRKEALRKHVIKVDDFPRDFARAEIAALEQAAVKMKAA
ncbi:MAG TPA: acyl-CoA dehydrogenase domain-containing protein, partial [Burkholderiales bacterium]|nr:acyl-CoA dehydrogenase domain-containing protein [Burkholderiales bacterium]